MREDGTPWNEDTGTGARDVRADEHRHGIRSQGNHVRGTGHNQDRITLAQANKATASRSDSYQIVEAPMDAAEASLDHQRSEGRSGKHCEEDKAQEKSGAAKRKAKSATRHRKRDSKRARVEVYAATVGRGDETQLGLHLIVGGDPPTPINIAGTVPWEHRGLLGRTRGGGAQ